MAEEKYAKAKCFILSPEGYQEISYLELCRRRDMEPDYQNRKFIPLHGMMMEVTPEQYAEFYRKDYPLSLTCFLTQRVLFQPSLKKFIKFFSAARIDLLTACTLHFSCSAIFSKVISLK